MSQHGQEKNRLVSDLTNKDIEEAIWHWIDEFIIKQNICPFALKERLANHIELDIYTAHDITTTTQKITDAFTRLAADANIQTSLVIAKTGLQDFNEYLAHLDECNYQLVQLGYEGIFQLASFHPKYQFAGEDPSALSNYTNRAPFPVFHIIREASITAALTTFSHPQRIPQRNIEHCESLGQAYFEDLLGVHYFN